MKIIREINPVSCLDTQENVAAYTADGDFDQVEKTLKCLNIPAITNSNAKKIAAKSEIR